MSLAQRFERRLESVVGTAFARVFKGQVEPVEIGTALQREATDKRNVMPSGEVLAPNRYRVTLAPSDYDRLVPWELQLTNSLAELIQEHLDENGWRTAGDIEVYLARDDSLHTGVFGVASRMESGVGPRRRPYDSLSLPAVPGHSPADYQQPYGSAPPAQDFGGYGQPGHAPHEADPFLGGAPPSAAPAAPPMLAPPPTPMYGVAVAGVDHAVPGGPYLPAAPYTPDGSPMTQPSSPPPAPPHQGQGYPLPPSGPTQAGVRGVLLVDGTTRRFELRNGSNLVGRGTDADLQLLDQGVSRRHLDVQFDGSFATVYDLGSTNGTSVNGHEVKSQLLRHGDVVRLGHTRLVFQQEQG
jgi:FHA domain-containing protein